MNIYTVRTEEIIRKNNWNIEADAETLINYADTIVNGTIRNAGLKTATELYKRAGFSVELVYYRLHCRKTLEQIADCFKQIDRLTA